jgi:hypothetical protein
VTEEFQSLATAVAARAGWAGMRMLVLPYPLVDRGETEMREVAREYLRPLLRTSGLPDRLVGE